MTASKILFCCLLISVLFGCLADNDQTKANRGEENVLPDGSTSLGIETIAIRQTAAGNMLDFRYKVLEPAKAISLFREDIRPYLIHEKTGEKLKVTDTTKVGPMRPTSRDPRAGKVYFMFFGNPHKQIKPGDKVTVVVGDQQIENLIVQ